MENLLISEEYVDVAQNCHCGDSGIYESRFSVNERGKLFLALQKEHGACVSRVYVDKKNGETVAVGWVFRKKVKYTDVNEYFTQETWVTLHSAMPETKTTYHHLEF